MNITTPPDTRSSQRFPFIATASVVVALTIGVSRAQAQVIPPLVPANLEVPSGNTAFLVGHAVGTQN
jgi:hypothetical protein